MNLLYQIKRSPFGSRDFEHLMMFAKEGSHVLFYQDAVLAAAITDENQERLSALTDAGVTVHAMSEDLSARGVKRVLPGIDVIDYAGWVDLVEAMQPVNC